jgi:hypothetical protein
VTRRTLEPTLTRYFELPATIAAMNSGLPAFALRYLMTRTWVSVLAVAGTTWVTVFSLVFGRAWISALGYGWGTALAIVYPAIAWVGAWVNTVPAIAWVIIFVLLVISSGGLAVALDVVTTRRRLLIAVLLVEAAFFGVGVGPAAFEYTVKSTEYPATDADVAWVLVVWGVPLVLLVLRAFGALKRVEPPPRRYRTPRVWQTGA